MNIHAAEVSALAAEGASACFLDAAGEPIEALRSVTKRFLPGSMVAITGPSGSGKTTLIHALAGIVPLTAGRIRYGGSAISSLGETKRDAWRHATCGMVFQDFRLIEELDILSNVILPATFAAMRVSGDLKRRAQELLERFEVPARSGPVAALSRGQRQRVALARALLMNPPVILADEPTASLDQGNADRIGQEFRALANAGKIVICVTHDEKLASQASSVLHMSEGHMTIGVDVPHEPS